MEIHEGHNKFYINDAQGKQIAEIVFVPTGEHLAIIEHTDVDESLKGQGIGKRLVAKVVEKMRRNSSKGVYYRNEEGQTWSGVGRQPRWLKEALLNGMKKEDFLVKDTEEEIIPLKNI